MSSQPRSFKPNYVISSQLDEDRVWSPPKPYEPLEGVLLGIDALKQRAIGERAVNAASDGIPRLVAVPRVHFVSPFSAAFNFHNAHSHYGCARSWQHQTPVEAPPVPWTTSSVWHLSPVYLRGFDGVGV
ncbi:hypothetical protein BDQ12DRAFT_671832 [Crucibulum laeve]|uniref:Uncharacterized protein n=1 Tax=Crucibulum laeve TaxID=68775 RepID=A0A5C3LEH6_9AGAR|nr:hypothetical protein BDQ12DRAFT_671832 [Crucibulum laeve]